ncbi:hypothetical protein BC936DRAFT_136756 [Jimgerdemannia flammicorona]|uniref:BTB domain-containing protein n=1 Tax=Jimgerdemannia flammicorona TaxID=994334 RepID=A0A433CYV8_9FUNG|nr:hypothetical protein BC936DRAFT_136756 [Jimgerdemannia flammicorona]
MSEIFKLRAFQKPTVNATKQRGTKTESGIDLKYDLKYTINNPDCSDVVFTCKDGIKIYASRFLLSTRSEMLRHLLCVPMREASTGQVSLEFGSAEFTVVLEYCYIEETPSLSLDNAVEVYRIAEFFILPRLKGIVVEYVEENLKDHAAAGRILSKAVKNIETNEESPIFAVVRRFFLGEKLVQGQLASLSKDALVVLLADINATKECPTDAFDLFKCIVDWAFEVVGVTENEARCNLLSYLDNAHKSSRKEISDFGIPHESITKIGEVIEPIIDNIPFEKMCSHQLVAIADTTFVSKDILFNELCKRVDFNTACGSTYVKRKFKWNPAGLRSSDDNTRIFRSLSHKANRAYRNLNNFDSMRVTSTSSLQNAGKIEWNIKVHSIGESSKNFLVGLYYNNKYVWYVSAAGRVTARGECVHTVLEFGQDTVVSFRADMTKRTCNVLVNGVDQGIVWTGIPPVVYPAACLPEGASCQFV